MIPPRYVIATLAAFFFITVLLWSGASPSDASSLLRSSSKRVVITESSGENTDVIAPLLQYLGEHTSDITLHLSSASRFGPDSYLHSLLPETATLTIRQPSEFAYTSSAAAKAQGGRPADEEPLPDTLVLSTCEKDFTTYSSVLSALTDDITRLPRNFKLVCVVHDANLWRHASSPLAMALKPFIGARRVEMVTLSPHTAAFLSSVVDEWEAEDAKALEAGTGTGTGTGKENKGSAVGGMWTRPGIQWWAPVFTPPMKGVSDGNQEGLDATLSKTKRDADATPKVPAPPLHNPPHPQPLHNSSLALILPPNSVDLLTEYPMLHHFRTAWEVLAQVGVQLTLDIYDLSMNVRDVAIPDHFVRNGVNYTIHRGLSVAALMEELSKADGILGPGNEEYFSPSGLAHPSIPLAISAGIPLIPSLPPTSTSSDPLQPLLQSYTYLNTKPIPYWLPTPPNEIDFARRKEPGRNLLGEMGRKMYWGEWEDVGRRGGRVEGVREGLRRVGGEVWGRLLGR
ncbi:hypothetical protein SAICODRAFT_71083 [Saitoella complicata NRRL Y-17804]|uniref:uncharacterized protein n=1 Tax=Saitoella complicata (strain BCRC 22490 / CBS 7301 / JCM 7358 / NBRC 10748 / NRRL Y-17804) TaxID=698492 RepID=UPI0008674149|nr:uncharacterized protein SAICODRAFT_71083 [Saitoella complicata NRRL Y-17804]ODQ53525.1 hypothetical protein SAICODRAFT_71083 [Saitoella complicata NRRL Y-17804]